MRCHIDRLRCLVAAVSFAALACLTACERVGFDEPGRGDRATAPGDGDLPHVVTYQVLVSGVGFYDASSMGWRHLVDDSGDHRKLLLVFVIDDSATVPIEVRVDGVSASLVTMQDAVSYGNISIWELSEPASGNHEIQAFLPIAISGFGYALTLVDVAPELWMFSRGSGTHVDGGSLSLACEPGTLSLMTVSWSNSHNTDWFGVQLELWDASSPGGSAELGSAAAISECAGDASFAWRAASGLSGDGSFLGLVIKPFGQ